MKILVLNCGSSSIKYQLLEMEPQPELLAKGLVERVGLEMGEFTHKPVGKEKCYVQTPIPTHEEGIKLVLSMLTDPEHGVIKSLDEIGAVGHRVAHGGEYFKESCVIGDKEREEIAKLCALAPLHNPASLTGIDAMKKLLPNVKHVGVFDTSFHQTMPSEAFLYALPYEYYTEKKIRRYGFHGTSHKYVGPKAAEIAGIPYESAKIVSCHLGNGASICAIKNGKSIDTSMGLTPTEGLMMGTRSGDVDPGALLYLMDKYNISPKQMLGIINKESGVQGVTGISSDMREIVDAADAGNEKARLGLDMYELRILKYIGAYVAEMNGVDLIAFTGGVGENQTPTRRNVCRNLEYLGIKIDEPLNDLLWHGKDGIISTPDSRVKVVVVLTDEEYMIARDTEAIVEGRVPA